MKKICSYVIVFVLLFALSACDYGIADDPADTSSIATNPTSEQETTQSQAETDSYRREFTYSIEDINIVYQEDKHFTIYTNENQVVYRYEVYTDTGEVLDQGYHSWRGSFGLEYSGNLLVLEYGSGGPIWSKRYYDVTKRKVSQFFFKPLCATDELVAYFSHEGPDGETTLIIQNIFDRDTYFLKISRDFSTRVHTDFAEAEFISGGTQLKITYWVNDLLDKEVTEIITLEG